MSGPIRAKRTRPTPKQSAPLDGLAAYLRLSETIPGWTRGEEADALAEVAQSLEGDAVIVEIGSFFGSSTVFLAGARKLKGAGKVHCIDPFDGSGDSYSVPHYDAIIMAFGALSPREHFDRHVSAAGVSDWVEVHQGFAEEIATEWTTPIDLLILDGDQSPAGARAAYEGYSPWLKPGGVIALHNSSPREYTLEHDGHYLIAREEIHPPGYVERHLIGSITFARKAAQPQAPIPWDAHGLPVAVRILAHLSNLGDVFDESGSINPGPDGLALEGILIYSDIFEYRVRWSDESWSDWSQGNTFVGTRGQSKPLTGVTIRLREDAKARFRLRTLGRFVGAKNPIQVSDGQDCTLSGRTLCGIKVELAEREHRS
jgi:predicted O-methyltransferase YrrM